MYVDFMSSMHRATERNYMKRVTDKEYPKHKAAELAKSWGYDYWDGDRRINYGGYSYKEGYWTPLANMLWDYYELQEGAKILDIGCGKGYLLYEFQKLHAQTEIHGIDISEYAISNSKQEVRDTLVIGNATKLPWGENTFDLVVSINTLHNLYNYELDTALREIERVGKQNKYLCVESYRSEKEKQNLLYWQVTCEAFNTPEEWMWWFERTGYSGDYSFIYFE